MKNTEGIETLNITMNNGPINAIIHPTLLWDDENVVLIDTGLLGSYPEIRDEFNRLDISLSKLNKIIITHQDRDHIGSVSELINELNQNIEVISSEEDKPYIQGEKILNKISKERMAQIQEQLQSMPPEEREKMQKSFQNPPKAQVTQTVHDKEELPYCGGLTVIHAPGHTPGNICLYHKQTKTLIAGDQLNIINGKLMGPNPDFTPDMNQAHESLKKLTEYDIEKVISYHTGIYTNNPNQRIAELSK